MLSSTLFLAIFGLVCGLLQASKVQQRIRFGEDAEDLSVLRFQQSITPNKIGICTATLITPQVILTAAHCFEERAIQTTVVYGCSDLKSSRCEEVEVISHTIHPNYVGKTNGNSMERKINDIAVAKLARPILGIRPKNLPLEDQTDPPRGYATLKGWGKTEYGRETDVLQSTRLQIVDNPPFSVSEDKILVDENDGPSGIERGDSGGPLLIGDTVIGVAAQSSHIMYYDLYYGTHVVKRYARYAVYMSVQYFSEFIQESIEKYSGK